MMDAAQVRIYIDQFRAAHAATQHFPDEVCPACETIQCASALVEEREQREKDIECSCPNYYATRLIHAPNCALRLASSPPGQRETGGCIDIVFDGPPAHESGRFVECEDENGHGVSVGEWIDRGNGLWALRIPRAGQRATGLSEDDRERFRDFAVETEQATERKLPVLSVPIEEAEWIVDFVRRLSVASGPPKV